MDVLGNGVAMKVGITGASANVVSLASLVVLAGAAAIVYEPDAGLAEAMASRVAQRVERHSRQTGAAAVGSEGDSASLAVVPALEDLAGCDAIVEMAGEALKNKLGLLRDLGERLPEVQTLVTTTSSLSVSRLASVVTNPARVVGLHLIASVQGARLAEVVPGLLSARETVDRVLDLVRMLGFHAVVVKNRPGLVVSRVSQVYFGEAMRLIEEGSASVEAVDALARGLGIEQGPFRMMDAMGLDTVLAMNRALFEASGGEPRYRPHVRLIEMVDAGLLGRRAGRGFYAVEQE